MDNAFLLSENLEYIMTVKAVEEQTMLFYETNNFRALQVTLRPHWSPGTYRGTSANKYDTSDFTER